MSPSASSPPSAARLGFIGGGRMAQALAAGIAQRSEGSSSIRFHDPNAGANEAFRRLVPGSIACDDNRRLVAESDLIVLAVKPPYVDAALAAAGDLTGKLVLSVVAGRTLADLAGPVGHRRIVRAMPNTPALVGWGATCYSLGAGVLDGDRERVEDLLASVGLAFEIPESALDAVTGVSGSGPAYVLLMIEALADGGVRMGLPRELALRLAARTVAGAGVLVERTGTHPALLREQVTSPGGTTAAALATLEAGAVRSHVQEAVRAAALRAAEMGREGSKSNAQGIGGREIGGSESRKG